ncbi:MAG: carboxypeptidase-like regulatory domain-containing protein [Pyrinomonadaceae bacterium]
MRFTKILTAAALMLGALSLSLAQDRGTATIKGRVRVETGSAAGVTVILRRGETELTHVTTNKNGEFLFARVAPGQYGLTFRKPGLSVGAIENVEVKAGKTRSLGDRLILMIDEGSIAFIRGSVFNGDGRSVPNAKVELAKLLDDGSVKKIDGRLTTETGSFSFRLAPDVAKYRVSVKIGSMDPITKDVEIDGAAVYRVALSLPPIAKP